MFYSLFMRTSAKREEFDILLKTRTVFNSPSLSLRVVKSTKSDKDLSRFSFVSSGKILKKAVDRNLFKRRGRHILRKLKDKLKNGHVGAFFVKKGLSELEFEGLEREIISLLGKSGILK